MTACLYNANPRWVEFLRGKGIRNDVNFWRKDKRILHLPAGSPFYFKELGAQRVLGRGFFRESVNMTAGAAWDRFGDRNGYGTREELNRRIPEALEIESVTDDTAISCLIIDGLEWLAAPLALPPGFFPQGILGAKFYRDEHVAFIADAFPDDSRAGAALPPIVLVQADATVGGEYDDWNDLTGAQYQFPNQYKNRVVSGRRFVYYRGVRRRGSARGQAEYFGSGTIGAVWPDEATTLEPRAADRAWFCAIENYVPFVTSVAAAGANGYFEAIPHARAWQVGVRPISEEVYSAILEAAGIAAVPVGPDIAEPTPLPIDGIALAEADNLLRIRVVRGPRDPGISAPPRRHSRRSNAIGRRAEELVYQRLTRTPGLVNVRWVSQMGQLDGFDLDYEADGVQQAVEVKGTTGTFFPCVELTINEWKAAERYRDRFHLYLVTRCEGPAPFVQIVHDPFGLFEAERAAVSPLIVRFELVAAPQA